MARLPKCVAPAPPPSSSHARASFPSQVLVAASYLALCTRTSAEADAARKQQLMALGVHSALLALLENADAVVVERSLLTLSHLSSLPAARELFLRSVPLIAAPLASPHRSVQLAAARVLASLWCQEEGGVGGPPPIATHDPMGARYHPHLGATSRFILAEFGLRGEFESAKSLLLDLCVDAAADKAAAGPLLLRGRGSYTGGGELEGSEEEPPLVIQGQFDAAHNGSLSFTACEADAASAVSFVGTVDRWGAFGVYAPARAPSSFITSKERPPRVWRMWLLAP